MNQSSDSKFVTKNSNFLSDQSNANYSVRNEVIYSTEVLKSIFSDYNDAYIPVRVDITIIGRNLATEEAFNNCAPFIKCIIKIDGTTIDYAKDLDLLMPMYNMLEYSSIILTWQLVYSFIQKMKQLILMLMSRVIIFQGIRLNY